VFSQSAYGSAGQSAEVKLDLVHVAPSPVFARFDGSDDGMPHGAKMFRCVFVLRRIAATDVTTDHAKPEMNPDISHLQAFFAATRVRFDIFYLASV